MKDSKMNVMWRKTKGESLLTELQGMAEEGGKAEGEQQGCNDDALGRLMQFAGDIVSRQEAPLTLTF